MLSVSDGIKDLIKSQYPMVEIKWDAKRNRFVVYEKYFRDTVPALRKIWDYENFDGSTSPLIGDVVMNFLHRADTRKWPLPERAKLWDKEKEDIDKKRQNDFSNFMQSTIIEDYNYIAGIPTFFMNPKFNARAVGIPT